MNTVTISSGEKVDLALVRRVADQGSAIMFASEVKDIVDASRKSVENILNGNTPVYGINTGFGNFKDKSISSENLANLQSNLIRSHACGVGEPFTHAQGRALLFVRMMSLLRGYSGVRFELVELVREMLNRDIIPVVPSQGSVGASGDLAPLCHAGLSLMGEGTVMYKGEAVDTMTAFNKEGLSPIEFSAKEGLAWSNGTSVMTAVAGLALYKAHTLFEWANAACAVSFEALRGCGAALDERIHKVRNQAGQIHVGSELRSLLEGSKLVNTEVARVQDSYTLRCSPQVHGAVYDQLNFAREIIERELNAVTDNPLVFSDGSILSGGNFHGEPVALASDSLGTAIAELGNISERRTAKLVDPATNHGLPAFLINPELGGVCSGLMIPQYVAAALVSENKVLAHPASVDSIPTSANQEDHVSMGTISARKLETIVDNVRNVVAIELLTACQAVNFVGPEKMGEKTRKIFDKVRKVCPFAENDRVFSTDIAAIASLMNDERPIE